MDFTKMQYEDTTLAEIAPDDEDELLSLARLADDEGMQHGVWMARSLQLTDDELAMMQNGLNPADGTTYSDEDRLKDIVEAIYDKMRDKKHKDDAKVWKIFSDDEPVGYMVYLACYGAPYIHFLMVDEYNDIETKTSIIYQAIMAAVPFIDYYFNVLEKKESYLFLYPFHEDVEDMEFELGQLGFQQYEDLDYYDYSRLACFGLERDNFEALKNSLE